LNLSLQNRKAVILISANAEWRAIKRLFPFQDFLNSPFGEFFNLNLADWDCCFFFGGWGKISSAATTQYVIDRFQPDLLVNLGTCGGIVGEINRGEVILAEKTMVYDIIELMGDFDEHIAFYTTELDLSWLKHPYPIPVRRTLLVSADRDLQANEVDKLKHRFQAIAGDWESGAIAWTAKRNNIRLLILRGVTDLVGKGGGEADGNLELFEKAASKIIQKLVSDLPDWLNAVR